MSSSLLPPPLPPSHRFSSHAWVQSHAHYAPKQPPRRARSSSPLSSQRLDHLDDDDDDDNDLPPFLSPTPDMGGIKKYNGDGLTVRPWDCILRDNELWLPSGDCLVYLFAKGKSRRGPSFLVSRQAMLDARCQPLLDAAVSPPPSRRQQQQQQEQEPDDKTIRDFELHVAAPASDSPTREATFLYHVSTRNFFAWLCRKPIAGQHLGRALVELVDRMALFRDDSVDNVRDVLDYAADMGYTQLVHCPDHALAMLYFAEHLQLPHLWIDAFAHCVGMNDALGTSGEFKPVSRVTKALITRASLEMDLHLEHAIPSLDSFLTDEMEQLGLTAPAFQHLDLFRTFLQSYCVAKFGYWPPTQDAAFSRPVYQSLYLELEALYDYLADKRDSDGVAADGGICVLQNIDTFNARNKYPPLPFRVPLLPRSGDNVHPRRSLIHLGKNMLDRKHFKAGNARNALREATNSGNLALLGCPLVQAYREFEDASTALPYSDITCVEARKVRWILLYGLLQTTLSIVQAPPEVSDTTTSYPLCCLTADLLPWTRQSAASSPLSDRSNHNRTPISDSGHSSDSESTVRPDCDYDYFGRFEEKSAKELVNTMLPVRRSKSFGDFLPLHGAKFTRLPAPLRRNGSGKSFSSQSSRPTSSIYSDRQGSVSPHPPSPSVESDSIQITEATTPALRPRTPTLEVDQLDFQMHSLEDDDVFAAEKIDNDAYPTYRPARGPGIGFQTIVESTGDVFEVPDPLVTKHNRMRLSNDFQSGSKSHFSSLGAYFVRS